jgi:UMP-CMP kinase
MVEGKLVPGEVAVQLMKKAMEKHGWNKKRYLIDGFPRGQENLDGWTKIFGDTVDVPFVVFFDANEDTMIERILERAKTSGRSDDNIESLKKRFATFKSESVPIVEYFEKKGKVRKINALHSIDEVNAEVVKVFKGYI